MKIFPLGKQAAKFDARTLLFSNYVELPPLPFEYYWSIKVSKYGMMNNDKCGCCTIAAAAHMTQTWSANANKEIIIPDNLILSQYSELSGYVPTTGENDTGLAELDVLKTWRKTGLFNNKIEAFTALNCSNTDHIKAAVYLFGGAYIGVGLPITAQGKNTWEVIKTTGTGQPRSWGGHAVPIVDFDKDWFYVVTWGKVLKMSYQFFSVYCDEAYAIISQDFIKDNKNPIGFDLDSLRKDLAGLN